MSPCFSFSTKKDARGRLFWMAESKPSSVVLADDDNLSGPIITNRL